MNVLSLFDGMSCGQIALERAGFNVDNYYASEIDKYAITVTQYNYPNTIQLGDITKWREWDIPYNMDLLLGGSPCQGFSFAGKQLNFDDPRSKLFFTYVDILRENRPKYFLLENVKMKKEHQNVISTFLGVEPIEINSALVSAQNRPRLYWTNIEDISIPKDKQLVINDILEPNATFSDSYPNYLNLKFGNKKRKDMVKRGTEKASCLTASMYKGQISSFCKDELDRVHKYTTIECERLQTIPDNYSNLVSNTQRYKMLGNGWTVDVIVHILNHMKGLI